MKGNGFIRKCNNFSNGRFVDIPTAFVHIVWIKEARPRASSQSLWMPGNIHKKFILLPLHLSELRRWQFPSFHESCWLFKRLKKCICALTEAIKISFECSHYWNEHCVVFFAIISLKANYVLSKRHPVSINWKKRLMTTI